MSRLGKLVTELTAPANGFARVSDDGAHRYLLGRSWDTPYKTVTFVMLNPSTADALADDATIRRCVGFARRWGFNRLLVVNLYAFRSTDPRNLLSAPDPVGPKNDATILEAVAVSHLVICAWGAHEAVKRCPERVARVLRLLEPVEHVEALQLTRDGHPWHPLYVPYEVTLVPFPPPDQARAT